jgi:RNA 2',3'-cyclic 3'-phosphodiesterase
MAQRMFVAVVPPQQLREAWTRLLQPLWDELPQLRWTVPRSWHFTCAFLPKVEDARLEAVEERLAEVAERTEPFRLEADGSGAFPDPDQATAIWLGAGAGSDALGRLAERCRNAAARCGVPVEGGRFFAHLTLARADQASVGHLLPALAGLGPVSWQVTEFELIASAGLKNGVGYRHHNRFRLGA